MIRTSFRLGTRMVLVSLVLVLTVTASFLLWVKEAPRSLPFLNSYIAYSFNALGGNYKVSIEKTLLLWDSQERKFDIRSVNMRLITASGVVGLHFPVVSLGFSLDTLLDGSLAPTNLTVLGPTLRFRTPTHPLSTQELETLYHTRLQQFLALMQEKNTLPFRRITLKNASLILDTPTISMLWHVPRTSLTMQIVNGMPTLWLRSSLDFTGEEATVTAHALLTNDNKIEAKLAVNSFPVHKLLMIIPFRKEIAPFLAHNNTHMVLTAHTTLRLNQDGRLEHGQFTIEDAYGKWFHPNYMQEPLYPEKIALRGTVTQGGHRIEITNASLRFQHDIALHLAMTADELFTDRPEYTLKIAIEHFPVNTMASFWPLAIAPKARNWVTSRISGGMVSKAVGTFHLRPEYFSNKHFPPDAIAATVHFSGTQLDYFPPLPAIEAITGVAHFDSNRIHITSSQARMKETVVTNAEVDVPYMDITGKSVTAKATAKGNAADLLAFIPIHALPEHTMPLHLQALEGEAESTVQLAIPYKPHLTLQDITLNAESTLTAIRVPKLLPHLDVTGGKLIATLTHKQLALHGRVLLNGNPSSVDATVSLNPRTAFTSNIHVKTTLMPKDTALLALHDGPELTAGAIAAQFHITHTQGMARLNAEMDAREATLTWERFNIAKPMGTAGNLHFAATIAKGAPIAIPSWEYTADGVQARGSLDMGEDFSVKDVHITQFVSGRNHFTLHYRAGPIPRLTIKGAGLDMEPVNFHRLLEPSKTRTGIILTVELAQLWMKNAEKLTNLRGKLLCSAVFCTSASFTASIANNNSVSLSLSPGKSYSVLVLRSDNAAALIRAIGIGRTIQGGTLQLHATFSHKPEGGTIGVGSITIRHFVTVNNPILSQILAVVTLPGIGLLNVLKGEGISFDKLDAPFSLARGVVILEDARATGPLLSITSNGEINLEASTLNMSGIVTPTVYGINSLVSRIPLVGKLLMGGKHQGIIAANYTLKGPIDKAALTVNPLSLLTPGFLRGIFIRRF